jgi:hypothetical protein
MPNRAWVREYLKVVPSLDVHIESEAESKKYILYLVRLVSEKVNLFETITLHMPEGVSLIPAVGKDIEGDFTANREGQTII